MDSDSLIDSLIIYVSKLFKIIEDQLPNAHGYADDTQLHLV